MKLRVPALLVFQIVLVPLAVDAGVIIVGDAADGLVDVNGIGDTEPIPAIRPGTGGNNSRGQAAIFFFELPNFASRETISAVDVELHYLGIDGSVPNFNLDLYGIGARAIAQIQASDYYDGSGLDATDTLIQNNIATPTTAVGPLDLNDGGRESVFEFVRSLYQADGSAIERIAVFRLSPDIDLQPGSSPIRGYLVAAAENSDNIRPRLEISTVPEAGTRTSWLLVLGALASLRAGLKFARF
jgi:hypothetical protein